MLSYSDIRIKHIADNQGQALGNTTRINGMGTRRASTMTREMISMKKKQNTCKDRINGHKEASITGYQQ